jgi:hypothetical protein
MKFFYWFSFPAVAVQEQKRSTLNLGLKKGAWILCIAEGKALLSSLASWACWACWRARLAGGLLALAGLAGCAGWACWLRACCLALGSLIFVSFQQLVCCYCLYLAFIFLFFFSIPREASRQLSFHFIQDWHVSSLRLFWSLNSCDGLKGSFGPCGLQWHVGL